MIENVSIKDIFIYEGEPKPVPICEGPMCKGYAECLAGRWDEGRKILIDYLVAMYTIRLGERSTSVYVVKVCRERGAVYHENREYQEEVIVREAATRRFDNVHAPVLKSIIDRGYQPDWNGTPVSMTKIRGRYFVGDGKNRCSILAALGAESVLNVEVT